MSKSDNNTLKALSKFTLTEGKSDPKEFIIVTNPSHPLFQDRALREADSQMVADMQSAGWMHGNVILVDEVVDGEPTGKQLVVAARGRTKAAILAGLKEVPWINLGREDQIPASELVSVMTKENERRKDNNTLEKAQEAQRLYNIRLAESQPSDWPSEIEWKPSKETKAAAVEFVAQTFGLSTGRIYMLFKLLDEDRTSPSLLKAISGKDPEVNMNGALKLSKLNPIEQEEALARLKPVITKKAEEAAKDPSGKKKRAASGAEVDAVVNKNATIKLQRAELEKTRARRSCPPEVKDYIKHLLNPGSIDLAYLPGRLEPLREKVEAEG